MMSRSPSSGFSLLELLVGVVVIGIATTVALTSYVNLRRDAQLRQAALELTGYLDRAKASARGSSSSCQLSMAPSTAAIGPSAYPGSCATQPTVNLNDEAGATGITASGTTSFSFTPRGFVTTPTVTYLSIPNSSIQACVMVNSPVGLIRKGFRPAASTGACNYVDWY
jgi:prepilin-type N-terminal cleavage/methylation domain-containing protein